MPLTVTIVAMYVLLWFLRFLHFSYFKNCGWKIQLFWRISENGGFKEGRRTKTLFFCSLMSKYVICMYPYQVNNVAYRHNEVIIKFSLKLLLQHVQDTFIICRFSVRHAVNMINWCHVLFQGKGCCNDAAVLKKRTLKHYDCYGQAWQKLYRGQMDDWIFISKSNEQQELKSESNKNVENINYFYLKKGFDNALLYHTCSTSHIWKSVKN